MASITKLKTSQSVQFFDHGVAFNLVQAFHRHLDLADLLQAFFAQAHTLLGCSGICYRNPSDDIDSHLGERAAHTASYNLTYQDANLGELVFFFRSRVTEDTLSTAEDLTSLIMSPIQNALLHRRALRAAEQLAPRPKPPAKAKPLSNKKKKKYDDDTLVLISLDGFKTIRSRDGAEWAQALIHTMQDQIREGLREADGVFQIDETHLAVLLPRTTRQGAERVAAKVEVLVGTLTFADPEVQSQLSVSIGISTTNGAASAEAVLADARTALSEAVEHDTRNIMIH